MTHLVVSMLIENDHAQSIEYVHLQNANYLGTESNTLQKNHNQIGPMWDGTNNPSYNVLSEKLAKLRWYHEVIEFQYFSGFMCY